MFQKTYEKAEICKAIRCKKAECDCDNMTKSPDGLFFERRSIVYLQNGNLKIECEKYEPIME